MKKERVMQICLYVVGAISALLFGFYPVAAITIAVVGSLLINIGIALQVVNYRDWHPYKPSTFWCASSIGAALGLFVLLVLIELSIWKLSTTGIVMIAILPSVTPIIGVLFANIIRVLKKEKAVFIV